MEWRPRLDDVDHAIIARLARMAPSYLTLRDLGDAPATNGLDTVAVAERIEILVEAGLVRRVDHFVVTAEGAALVEQAAGRAGDTADHMGTVVVSRALSEAPSPAEPVLSEAA